MKTKALQEGFPQEKAFTNKINYGLEKILKTLAKEPKVNQDKRLITYQANKGEWKSLET
jgi:hypothetical protein